MQTELDSTNESHYGWMTASTDDSHSGRRTLAPNHARSRLYSDSSGSPLDGRMLVKADDKVELRSPAEILATLDARGCLEGLPFMPEMLGFFGTALTVTARVERACDTFDYTGVRRLRDTVILGDLRCEGTGHAGCQAQCRLYWKEAWLRPASLGANDDDVTVEDALAQLEILIMKNVHGVDSRPEEPTFSCQATELLRASEPVGWWNARSFVHEFTSGNVRLGKFVRVISRIVVEEIARRLGRLSDQPFRPNELGGTGVVTRPPLGLRPGELVQIRTRPEIGKTLGENGKNRGLWFDREMVPYCGRTARVKTKVERFIDEKSGRVIELASDCYILDEVVCQNSRSSGRWFCPRAIYPWWREAWLKRLEQDEVDRSPDAFSS